MWKKVFIKVTRDNLSLLCILQIFNLIFKCKRLINKFYVSNSRVYIVCYFSLCACLLVLVKETI